MTTLNSNFLHHTLLSSVLCVWKKHMTNNFSIFHQLPHPDTNSWNLLSSFRVDSLRLCPAYSSTRTSSAATMNAFDNFSLIKRKEIVQLTWLGLLFLNNIVLKTHVVLLAKIIHCNSEYIHYYNQYWGIGNLFQLKPTYCHLYKMLVQNMNFLFVFPFDWLRQIPLGSQNGLSGVDHLQSTTAWHPLWY